MGMEHVMKRIVLIAGLSLAVVAPSAAAANCFVDYKAKQTAAGLKLHYGVMKLPDRACTNNAAAQRVVAKRLANNGWTLLTIVSRFDGSGLSQRQANAGAYYLRY